MFKKSLLACLLALLVGSQALAQGPVVTSFSGGSPFGIFYGGSTGDVVGFRFTADTDLMVTDLGVYNDAAGVTPGLDNAHMVGLWRNSDQALLASTMVDASGTLIGEFYYESISPVVLASGGEYTLGALYTATDDDSYISSPTGITLDGISSTNGVFPAAGDLGFAYPTEDSTNLARFGANAIWSVVPEPSGMLLLSLAASMFAMIRKR